MRQKRLILALLAVVIVIALVIVTINTRSTVEEGYVPSMYASAWALLPPVIAIILALITKEVYSSLFLGIVTGALLYSNGNLELAFNTILYNEEGGLVINLTDSSNASILTFVVLLAAITYLMNKAGGSAAFGVWAKKHIKSRVGAQLATMLLGVLIFVDDGFNCMTVGSVMRPITDRQNVSRSKLAYLIDSTAAPICIIAPISSWAAAVSYSVPEELGINGFQMFIRTIPYNLYALTTLFMMVVMIKMKLDYGPMRTHELNAMKGDLFSGAKVSENDQEETLTQGKVIDLIVPVAVLLVSCIACMLYTGGFFSGVSLIDAFADANSAYAMVMGSMITLIVTFVFYLGRGVMSFKEFMESLPKGWGTMVGPMLILIMAWNLSGMTGLLGAKDFVREVVASSAGALSMLLPAIIFLVAVFLAFATGTSWGTFSILIPIVCVAFADSYELMVIAIAACLSGAVCGDHCSPISDTTIMSSAGSHCDHVNHFSTQMPYALTAAIVSAAGYVVAGIIGYVTGSPIAYIATPITLVLMMVVLSVIKKRQQA